MSAGRFLIVGASGFVGRHLRQRLGPERTIATYHRTPIAGGIRFDAATMPTGALLEAAGGPVSHAFVLGSVTNIDACARDPAGSDAVNRAGMIRLLDGLIEAGAVPVYASSDAVFDGRRGRYGEDDPLSPILTYGRQKAAVETHLRRRAEPWLIARLSKVVSTDPKKPGLFSEWLAAIEAGRPIRAARDQVFSPVLVEDAVEAMLALAEKGCTGVYNVCGPRPWSRLALVETFVAALREMRPDLAERAEIVPCGLHDLPLAEPRPLDCSMSAAKLEAALGRPLRDMAALCREAARRAAELSR